MSKLNIKYNSTSAKPRIQHSTLKTQHCRRQQFNIEQFNIGKADNSCSGKRQSRLQHSTFNIASGMVSLRRPKPIQSYQLYLIINYPFNLFKSSFQTANGHLSSSSQYKSRLNSINFIALSMICPCKKSAILLL